VSFSERERISHVFRRLGFGAQPELVAPATTVDDAIATALDLTAASPPPPALEPPTEVGAAPSRPDERAILRYWAEQMTAGPRRIEKRLVWFWHNHFATDIRKVRMPYLMYRQHLTLRKTATGSFADLLHAVAIDPAMLVYLDGVHNASDAINENFAREVMELFTMGPGNYTEADVIEASRAFSGWTVLRPGGRATRFAEGEPWSAQFAPSRHDGGQKTLLGTTGRLDAAGAINVLLDQPATARFISAKLFREFVGQWPDDSTNRRIADVFRRDYQIMDLMEAIVSEPAFFADAAIWDKVRSPLEQAIGIVQAFGPAGSADNVLLRTLRTVRYVPFVPPNVAGFPRGTRLLGPHRLIHTFDFTGAIPADLPEMSTGAIMARLGIFDLTRQSRTVLDAVPDVSTRVALAINSPEFNVT